MMHRVQCSDTDIKSVYNEKSNHFVCFEKKEINGYVVEITTSSLYPIPWNAALMEERPADYYEQQSKKIRYFKEDVDHHHKPIRHTIDIEIPAVDWELNRKRLINVKVDGIPITFLNNSILNMNHTFNIHDVNLLMQIAYNNTHLHSNPTLLQTVTPFIYLPEVNNDRDYEYNRKHSAINKIIFPYLQEMSRLDGDAVTREILIPVITKGAPHHWNLCVLTIDKNNIPSLTYVESGNLFKYSGLQTYADYMSDYQYYILPQINGLLMKLQYPMIDKVKLCQGKQFSEEGCGIAMSLNVQKILAEKYPPVILNSSMSYSQFPNRQIISKLSSGVSIEEDAIMRTELALKIHLRESLIAEKNVENKEVKIKSLSCNEILNHPHTLAIKAKEAFTFFKSVNENDHKESLPPLKRTVRLGE